MNGGKGLEIKFDDQNPHMFYYFSSETFPLHLQKGENTIVITTAADWNSRCGDINNYDHCWGESIHYMTVHSKSDPVDPSAFVR